MYFHEYLQWLQNEQELTRREIFERLKIDESTLSYWFSKKRRPQLKMMTHVLKTFHQSKEDQLIALEIIFFGAS